MTPARRVLQLAAPLLSLLLLLLAASHAPAPASASTLAVAGGVTVCGVAKHNGTAYCADFSALTANASYSSSPVAESFVFSRVSGGAGFLCAVGGTGGDDASVLLLCWSPGGQLRRVYRGYAPLADLAVGDDHVAAYDAQARGVRWWRGGRRFPDLVLGAFRSLVSGDGAVANCAMAT